MMVTMRYTIRAREIKPTIAFSISIMCLDLLAGPDEDDHQAKEADGSEEIKNVRHGERCLVGQWLSPGLSDLVKGKH
jgi:hypothetical protein